MSPSGGIRGGGSSGVSFSDLAGLNALIPETLDDDGDARDPTAHAIDGAYHTGEGDSVTKSVGTGAGTVAAGDDARLSDTRDPNAHASDHESGGADELNFSIYDGFNDSEIDPMWTQETLLGAPVVTENGTDITVAMDGNQQDVFALSQPLRGPSGVLAVHCSLPDLVDNYGIGLWLAVAEQGGDPFRKGYMIQSHRESGAARVRFAKYDGAWTWIATTIIANSWIMLRFSPTQVRGLWKNAGPSSSLPMDGWTSLGSEDLDVDLLPAPPGTGSPPMPSAGLIFGSWVGDPICNPAAQDFFYMPG